MLFGFGLRYTLAVHVRLRPTSLLTAPCLISNNFASSEEAAFVSLILVQAGGRTYDRFPSS